MHKLVLVRHGESIWNRDNKFTGWTDVDLTEKGIHEAHTAAKALQEKGLDFDVAFTSVLKRAIRTLWLVMDDMDRMWIPVHRSWRLNERMYGGLQGWDKAETARDYGDEQVHTWRRSYDVRPPALEKDDARHPVHDPKYAHLPENEVPAAESLEDTIARLMPYWHGTIAPVIQKGQRVIISAHGNSLRGLVKHLDGISDQEIPGLNIPTGIPLVYELDAALKPIRHYYLADPETVEKAAAAVAAQGKSGK